jgi:hypothetical protein
MAGLMDNHARGGQSSRADGNIRPDVDRLGEAPDLFERRREVCVAHEHEVGIRRHDAFTDRETLAAVAVEPDRAKPGSTLEEQRGSIGGAVVDDDDVDELEASRREDPSSIVEPFEQTREPPLLVECRNDECAGSPPARSRCN